jgi:hypothetical protein
LVITAPIAEASVASVEGAMDRSTRLRQQVASDSVIGEVVDFFTLRWLLPRRAASISLGTTARTLSSRSAAHARNRGVIMA